jgi:hypothetical protein
MMVTMKRMTILAADDPLGAAQVHLPPHLHPVHQAAVRLLDDAMRKKKMKGLADYRLGVAEVRHPHLHHPVHQVDVHLLGDAVRKKKMKGLADYRLDVVEVLHHRRHPVHQAAVHLLAAARAVTLVMIQADVQPLVAAQVHQPQVVPQVNVVR